jgi:hypothetical protein
MRKGFLGVPVPPKALHEPEPGRKAGNDRTDEPNLINTPRGIPRHIKIPLRRRIETNQVLKVEESRNKTIELIRQPEMGKLNVEERGGNDVTLNLNKIFVTSNLYQRNHYFSIP